MSLDNSNTSLNNLAGLYTQLAQISSPAMPSDREGDKKLDISNLANQCLLTCSKAEGVTLSDLKIEKKPSGAWKWFLRIVSFGGYAVYEHFNKLRERTNLQQIRDFLNGTVTAINKNIQPKDLDEKTVKNAENFIEFVNSVIQHVNIEYKKSTNSNDDFLKEISKIKQGGDDSTVKSQELQVSVPDADDVSMKATHLTITIPPKNEGDIAILDLPDHPNEQEDMDSSPRAGQAIHLKSEPVKDTSGRLIFPEKPKKVQVRAVTTPEIVLANQFQPMQQTDAYSLSSLSTALVSGGQVSELPSGAVKKESESRERSSTIEVRKPVVSSPSIKNGQGRLLQELEARALFSVQRATRSQDNLFAPENTEERFDYLIAKAKKEQNICEWMIIETTDKKHRIVSVEYSEDDDTPLCDEQEIQVDGTNQEYVVEGMRYPSIDLMLLDRGLMIYDELKEDVQEDLKNKILLSLSVGGGVNKKERDFYYNMFKKHFIKDNYFIIEILKAKDCFKLNGFTNDKMSVSSYLLELMLKNDEKEDLIKMFNEIIQSNKYSAELKVNIQNLINSIKK